MRPERLDRVDIASSHRLDGAELLKTPKHYAFAGSYGVAMKSVLIVEDEIFVAMDIERVLTDAGYHVAAIAADKEEALSAAERVQLAFVDLNLRDGATGSQVARELARRHGIKIVYVTANVSQIGEPAETAIGCIRKPFADEAILEAAELLAADGKRALGGSYILPV